MPRKTTISKTINKKQNTAKSQAKSGSKSNKKSSSVKKSPKILIAYYTRTNTTMRIAHDIGLNIGGDLRQIRDLKNRKGIFGWLSAGRDALREKETEIHFSVQDISKYDYIVLGTPTWASNLPPATRTVLNELEAISGVKFALFSVCAGNSGKTLHEMKSILKKKKAKVVLSESFVMGKKSHKEIRDEIIKFSEELAKKLK